MILSSSEEEASIGVINGASLVSPPQQISPEVFGALNDLNASWVALIPFGFSRAGQPTVSFDHSRQWWGERTDGTCELVKCAKNYNLKVLMKPHVWVRGQGWPGEYDLETEEEWQIWERTYREYILNYARVSDSMKVDMLCIGTEFRIGSVKREPFWRELIREVREIYDGPLTYAANWDNYQKVKFWDELDYIGVDAYFPLTDNPEPSVEEIEQGWQESYRQLKQFSKQYDKPMLFTEYGYQSLKGAAGKHWEIDKSHHYIDMEVQANAYEALYNVFWEEDWFVGGFFWKWHLRDNYGGPGNPNFTPQGKLAEQVIRQQFAKASSDAKASNR